MDSNPDAEGPRAVVLRHVRAHPGCHLRQLERALPLSLGALRHHLDRLEAEGLLHVEFDRRYKRYYPPGMAPATRRAHAALRQERLRRVALAVAARPGVRHGELARVLGLPGSSLTTYLRRLLALGVLQTAPGGGFVVPAEAHLEEALRGRATVLDRLADGALRVLEDVERGGEAGEEE